MECPDSAADRPKTTADHRGKTQTALLCPGQNTKRIQEGGVLKADNRFNKVSGWMFVLINYPDISIPKIHHSH